MFKTLILLIVIAMLICSPLLLIHLFEHTTRQRARPDLTAAGVLGRIRHVGVLNLLELPATQVVTGDIRGRLGSTCVTAVVQLTATLGVDLDQAEVVQLDAQLRHITLMLPLPGVTGIVATNFPGEGTGQTVVSASRTGLWRLVPGPAREIEALQATVADAHERLKRVAGEPMHRTTARHRAEDLLNDLLGPHGWTVHVRWRDSHTEPLPSPPMRERGVAAVPTTQAPRRLDVAV